MKQVFVFGSNEGGLHGGGAALHAHKNLGAVWGVGYGHTGDTFAVPTKGFKTVTTRVAAADGLYTGNIVGDSLPLSTIREYVIGFKAYARARKDITFKVTQIGCGLAGFKAEDMAPLFAGSPDNVFFDLAWQEVFDKWEFYPKYWGTA